MIDTAKSVRVGLLLVLAVVATYGIYRLVDERSGSAQGYRVWAVFDDAQGLIPKSRVLIAGIQVGHIEDIRLWKGRARVDLRIRSGVKIYRDGRLAKRSVSILGENMVVIHPGSFDKALIKDGDRLEAAASAMGTDDIMQNVGAVAVSVRKVAEQLERSFGHDEAGNQMSSALKNLTEALEGVNRTIKTNEKVVGNTLGNIEQITSKAAPQIERILASVANTTQNIERVLGEKAEGQKSGAEEVSETLSSINRASKNLEGVMQDVHEITERTAKGEGTLGRLTSDEALIDEVQGVVEGVGDFVGGIQRLQTIVGLRSEYNMLANTFKSYVELRLQPSEDRYYLVQLIDDPRGSTDFTQTTVRRSPPAAGESSFYQENRVVTSDAFRFSLMFAKRIHFATLRFGILESTGGLGVDWHLLDDKIELNTDVFAFGDQAFPRLRARLAYEFVKRLWVLGGIDDAFNETSDFFMGAQLRFNDEDLKPILPFVPSTP